MMQTLYSMQNLAMLILGVAAFGAGLFCFVDALRYPAEVFTAAGKLTKTWWLIITGVAMLVTFAAIGPGGAGLFLLIAVVAIGVYLADVRPALKSIAPSITKRKGSGGHGPYGSW